MEIREIHNSEQKSKMCNEILRALPNWFGMEEGIVDYTEYVRDLPFFCAYIDEKPIGFIALKDHGVYTSEVYVMGILMDHHRKGFGKQLICQAEAYCAANGKEFLTVKTLDESRESKDYEKTRLFYLALGFKPLEVFPLLWDEENPCLFLAKNIALHQKINDK